MNKHLEKALEAAGTSKCRHKHGAVVVNSGKVVAVATNKKVGDPNIAWRRAHIHAEIAAVSAAGTRAKGASVYVARAAADGSPAVSKPCKKCERYMERSGVTQVVWT
jgi:pyrimidine deaminase RibD-like protein